MTDQDQELLTILAEECGESVQAVCKALRHGLGNFHPDYPEKGSNASQIEREVGDILAIVDMLIATGAIRWRSIHHARFSKVAGLRDHTNHLSGETQSSAAMRLRRAHRHDNDLRELGLQESDDG